MTSHKREIVGDARKRDAIRILKSDKPSEYTAPREKRGIPFGFTSKKPKNEG